MTSSFSVHSGIRICSRTMASRARNTKHAMRVCRNERTVFRVCLRLLHNKQLINSCCFWGSSQMRGCNLLGHDEESRRERRRRKIRRPDDRRARHNIICSPIKLARYRPTDNFSVTTNFMPGNQQSRIVLPRFGKQGTRTKTARHRKEKFIRVLIGLRPDPLLNFARVYINII